MPAPDKSSVIAQMASDLGTSMAHTPSAPENSALGDLFGVLDDEIGGHDASTIAPVKRGRGRPPGSISRTTKQLQGYLQSRGYRDPAEFLASVVSMDTIDLAKALTVKSGDDVIACEPIDALKVQVAAARELMPYFHQRLPQQVEHVGEGARPLIIITDGSGSAAVSGVGDGDVMSVHDIVINQQVSGGGNDA